MATQATVQITMPAMGESVTEGIVLEWHVAEGDTVSEGDTLYSIAEKYELPVSLLMKVNGIENPYNLQIGMRLCIPGTEDQLPSAPGTCAKTHTVKAGDTLYLIAKMHNVKLDALMRANPNIDPYNMLVGTELCIPM